jgi:uncharacterized protein (TIGR02145 family)
MKTKRFYTAALILALVFAQVTTTFAQSVGINEDGSEPDSRAILDVKSNSKGVILPRLTDSERAALSTDIPFGMIIFNTTDSALQIFMGTAWYNLSLGSAEEAWEFYDVTNPTTGQTWIDRNLGASQVATSSTDADAYGDLYQWGRGPDGHEKRTSATTSTLSSSDTPGHGDFITDGSFPPVDWRSPQNDNLWQGLSGTNNPCPCGYRLPTEAEWEAERQSWSSNDAAGAFASPLKLPVGGRRQYSGSFYNVGSSGQYWSSTVDDSESRYLGFGSDARMYSRYRAYGASVRCIKE